MSKQCPVVFSQRSGVGQVNGVGVLRTSLAVVADEVVGGNAGGLAAQGFRVLEWQMKDQTLLYGGSSGH